MPSESGIIARERDDEKDGASVGERVGVAGRASRRGPVTESLRLRSQYLVSVDVEALYLGAFSAHYIASGK